MAEITTNDGDSGDSTDDEPGYKSGGKQLPYECGGICDDGTACERSVPYEFIKCHKHRGQDD